MPKLTLLLGASGSGKSYQLREEMLERAKRQQKSMILVPEQFTSSTEAALYRRLGDRYSGYVESYSFTSLAEKLLRRYGGTAIHTLSRAGRVVLVRRAVKGLDLTYYKNQSSSTAFCEKMVDTIDELQSAGIEPELLRSRYAVGAVGGADPDKLREIALIYGAYQALLSQSLVDSATRQQRAVENLQQDPARKEEFFAGYTVFLDEFDTFNAPKRALLKVMLSVTDVTVALCCDGQEDHTGGTGTFSGAKRVVGMLKSLAESVGAEHTVRVLTDDPRHQGSKVLTELSLLLADPDYQPETTVDPAAPAVTLYPAETRAQEVKAAVAALREQARQRGGDYSRMAIICRDLDPYLSALRYEFRLQGVPFFCDEPTSPEHTAPARAVRAALRLLTGGLTSQKIMELVKTGVVNLPLEQYNALENYAYTWNPKQEDWEKPFDRNPSGYTGNLTMNAQEERERRYAETARENLMGHLLPFVQKCGGVCTVEKRSLDLYHLLMDLGAAEVLKARAAKLREQGETAAGDEALREWNVVMSLLGDMVDLAGTTLDGTENQLKPTEYDELFALLLRSTDMGHIPQSQNAVIVTTAGRMRLPDVDVCLVLGLAEGEFPQTPGDQGLLSHADRDWMIEQGAELPDSFENHVIREKVCFYKALTAARRKLWLSWPGGSNGVAVSAALQAILEPLQVPEYHPTQAELGATPAAALDLLGGMWHENTPTRAAVLQALEQAEQIDPYTKAGVQAVQNAAQGAGGQLTKTGPLEHLLGGSLRMSPSSFERYITCPYRYFLHDIVRARPRNKAEMGANISGLLTHWVLEHALQSGEGRFHRVTEEEKAAGVEQVELDNAAMKQLVDTLTAKYVEEYLPGGTERMNYVIERIKRNLVDLLMFIQSDILQSGFVPVAFELRIELPKEKELKDAAVVAPLELMLGDESLHSVRIMGTIDRVDAMTNEEGTTYIRVVDYKTGNNTFDLAAVREGLDCQMLLYLFTLQRNGAQALGLDADHPLKCAGVEYLLSDPSPELAGQYPHGTQAERNRVYELQGLTLDEQPVYLRMDTEATGTYVPFRFAGGRIHKGDAKKAASEQDMEQIRTYLEQLLKEKAKEIYDGKFEADPLQNGPKSPCLWCDYRVACRRASDEECRMLQEKGGDPFGLKESFEKRREEEKTAAAAARALEKERLKLEREAAKEAQRLEKERIKKEKAAAKEAEKREKERLKKEAAAAKKAAKSAEKELH